MPTQGDPRALPKHAFERNLGSDLPLEAHEEKEATSTTLVHNSFQGAGNPLKPRKFLISVDPVDSNTNHFNKCTTCSKSSPADIGRVGFTVGVIPRATSQPVPYGTPARLEKISAKQRASILLFFSKHFFQIKVAVLSSQGPLDVKVDHCTTPPNGV